MGDRPLLTALVVAAALVAAGVIAGLLSRKPAPVEPPAPKPAAVAKPAPVAPPKPAPAVAAAPADAGPVAAAAPVDAGPAEPAPAGAPRFHPEELECDAAAPKAGPPGPELAPGERAKQMRAWLCSAPDEARAALRKLTLDDAAFCALPWGAALGDTEFLELTGCPACPLPPDSDCDDCEVDPGQSSCEPPAGTAPKCVAAYAQLSRELGSDAMRSAKVSACAETAQKARTAWIRQARERFVAAAGKYIESLHGPLDKGGWLAMTGMFEDLDGPDGLPDLPRLLGGEDGELPDEAAAGLWNRIGANGPSQTPVAMLALPGDHGRIALLCDERPESKRHVAFFWIREGVGAIDVSPHRPDVECPDLVDVGDLDGDGRLELVVRWPHYEERSYHLEIVPMDDPCAETDACADDPVDQGDSPDSSDSPDADE